MSTGTQGFGLVNRYTNSNNYYKFYYSHYSKGFKIGKVVNGTFTTLNVGSTYNTSLGTTYKLRFSVYGNTLKGYVNGVLQCTATDNTFTSGYTGIASESYKTRFDNVISRTRAAELLESYGNENGRVMVSAHRGAHTSETGSLPENSIAGVTKTINIGADIIETDIRKTSDGIFMMLHDDTIDRTTNGSGSINNKTYAYVRTYFLNGGEGEGALTNMKVPTFSEYLDAAKDAILIDLDIKCDFASNKQAIYDQIKAKDMLDQVIMKSTANYASVSSWLLGLTTKPIYTQSLSATGDQTGWINGNATIRPYALESVSTWSGHALFGSTYTTSVKNGGMRLTAVMVCYNFGCVSDNSTGWTNAIGKNYNIIMTNSPQACIQHVT
jgi:glycerophosphoryl diester phosphodiesterase